MTQYRERVMVAGVFISRRDGVVPRLDTRAGSYDSSSTRTHVHCTAHHTLTLTSKKKSI